MLGLPSKGKTEGFSAILLTAMGSVYCNTCSLEHILILTPVFGGFVSPLGQYLYITQLFRGTIRINR